VAIPVAFLRGKMDVSLCFSDGGNTICALTIFFAGFVFGKVLK